MGVLTWLGPWGLSVPAFFVAFLTATALGLATFPREQLRTRVIGGLTLCLALYVASLQALFYLNGIIPWLLWSLQLGFLALALVVLRWRGLKLRALLDTGHSLLASLRPLVGSVSQVPVLLIAAAAIAVSLTTSYLLPVWHWDSLGYHLPFVNFVLQGGGMRELPYDVPYLSTYPRNVELCFVALRSVLPDDRLVDIGQLPLALIAGVTVMGIARQWGATLCFAACAALLWLSMPAVFLQLPSNYIDVGTAAFFLLASYFLLLKPTPAVLLCAGLAIGLFLGTKPSAPPAVALLSMILLFRGWRSGQIGLAVLSVWAAALLGLEAYLTEFVRHGNPVWPAVVEIGPISLPGTISVDELLSSGAGTEKVHGSLLWRVVQSWSALDAVPVFDMRRGGLGIAFLLSLPLGLYFCVREKNFMLAGLAAIALVTPDPAVARYILPFPALMLAASFALLSKLLKGRHSIEKHVVPLLSAGLAGLALFSALPGLKGEGPELSAYFRMSWQQRLRAVGANGRPTEFVDARQKLKPGEVAVYDKAFYLPYLMWRSDLKNRVVRVDDRVEPASLQQLLQQPEVRLIAAGEQQPLSALIRSGQLNMKPIFECRESCVVYWRP